LENVGTKKPDAFLAHQSEPCPGEEAETSEEKPDG